MTYHGPGQLVAYLLFDLRRAKVGVRWIVEALEQAVIDMLGSACIAATRREGAPGVYVKGRKIASVGLRVRATHARSTASRSTSISISRPSIGSIPAGSRFFP